MCGPRILNHVFIDQRAPLSRSLAMDTVRAPVLAVDSAIHFRRQPTHAAYTETVGYVGLFCLQCLSCLSGTA